MINNEKVLLFVKQKGPCIPRDLVKEMGGDTFIIGAVLSQLVDSNQIKISNTKVGGSPIYYVEEQREKLQNFYNHLNGMEKKAYDYLKQNKVLRDKETDPAVRVALRHIKDFAKGLEVNIGNSPEIFWKWYLLSNQEAEQIIRQILKQSPQEQEYKKEETQPQPENVPTEKQEEHKDTKEDKKEEKESQRKLTSSEKSEDDLSKSVYSVFKSKDIEIVEENIIRKNSEADYFVIVNTKIGKVRFFVKVKNKKKINDKDLSSAYVDGQMKKMPVLFVTTGELTKKAEEKLETDFKTITVLFI